MDHTSDTGTHTLSVMTFLHTNKWGMMSHPLHPRWIVCRSCVCAWPRLFVWFCASSSCRLCLWWRQRLTVCVLVLMFGVRYVPSVMPQSEISPAANNSKTRKQPKGRRNYKVEPLASVFRKTKVDILRNFRCQFVIRALRLNTFFRKLRLNQHVHWYFSELITPLPRLSNQHESVWQNDKSKQIQIPRTCLAVS